MAAPVDKSTLSKLGYTAPVYPSAARNPERQSPDKQIIQLRHKEVQLIRKLSRSIASEQGNKTEKLIDLLTNTRNLIRNLIQRYPDITIIQPQGTQYSADPTAKADTSKVNRPVYSNRKKINWGGPKRYKPWANK